MVLENIRKNMHYASEYSLKPNSIAANIFDGNVGAEIIICLAIQAHIRRGCTKREKRAANTYLFQTFIVCDTHIE